jgi:RecJ-like exonuclease
MTDNTRTLPCPLCNTPHLVPVSRNRSKCKGCSRWLQINDKGDALQDFYLAKDKTSIAKRGYILIKSNKKYF